MKKNNASAGKRALALIMALFMLLTAGLSYSQMQTAYAAGTASEWDGTVADPGAAEYVVNNSDKTVHLKSAQAMVWFIRQIYNGNDFNGYTVCLDVDVDLDNIDFTFNEKGEVFPYDGSKPFRGIFDGQDHTISNFKMTTQNYRAAMFRQTENATFKNITFSNPTIYSWDSNSTSYDSHAVLVGYHNAGTLTFDNVHIEGGSVEGARAVGALVGFVAANSSGALLTINNCSNSATITGRGNYVGGFAGMCNPGVRATNCENTGSVKTSGHLAGGIIGWIEDDPSVITGCSNSGNITGADCVGGILGYCGSPEFDPSLILTNNTNTGNITARGTYAAGIAASIDTDGVHEISGNINRGAVSANADAGGIVGRNKGLGEWKNNKNYGTVTASTLHAGGICAEARDNDQSFNNCLNEGSVTGYYATGGILGHVPNNDHMFTNCTNSGDITSTGEEGKAGGILGYHINGVVRFTECCNKGKIRANKDAGGLAATINGIPFCTYSWNAGNVGPYSGNGSGSAYGGLVGTSGYDSAASRNVNQCYNWGEITGGYAGGIIGLVDNGSKYFKIANSYNTGSVKGYNNTGQFIGFGGSIDETCYTNVKTSGATYKTDQEFIDCNFRIGDYFVKNKDGVTVDSTTFYFPIFGHCSHDSGFTTYYDENGPYYVCQNCGQRFESDTPLDFDGDETKLTGSNWMSGISGDRYLSEINIPGAHDAGMARPYTYGHLAGSGYRWAKTQNLNIYEQMEAGIRMLDIRLSNKLNNDYLHNSPVVCHGDFQEILGVEHDMRYYALWNEYLYLDIVLDCCKRFLADNPTETILLDLTYETGDKYETYNLARKNLDEFGDLIYTQNGSNIITTMPQLKDTRGKVVVLSKDTLKLHYGMQYDTWNDWGTYGTIGGKKLSFENHYEAGNEEDGGRPKWEYVSTFFNGGTVREYYDIKETSIDAKVKKLPRNVTDHLDACNVVYTSANRAKTLGDDPAEIAEYVNARLYTDNDSFIKTKGRGYLYGWIYSDFVTAETSKVLWLTNYPDDLEYCTVTYVYGDGSSETFRVMKGTELRLTIDKTNPGNSFFDSWMVDGKSLSIGNKIVIDKDTRITAQWAKGGSDQTDKTSVVVASAKAKGRKALKISWNKVNGAAKYEIWMTKCGKKAKYKKVKTLTAGKTSFTKDRLKKNTAYSFCVVAKDSSGKVIGKSYSAHVYTNNYKGSYTNAKSLRLSKKSITLNTGKAAKIKATQTKAKKGKKLCRHTALLRYRTDNANVATVSKNGVITAKGTGTCKIYVQTVNGIWKTVAVNVK